MGGKVEKKSIFPFSPHFPLASCLHLSFSPRALLLCSPSLHRGIQCLRWEPSSLKVIQNCASRRLLSPPYLPPYPSRHPIYPPPSAPTPPPSGGPWIPLNSGKPCSKSQPGLSAPAAGLTGRLSRCSAETERWEAWQGESRGGYEGLTGGSVG